MLSPRTRPSLLTRPCCIHQYLSFPYPLRTQSTAASIFEEEPDDATQAEQPPPSPDTPLGKRNKLLSMPSPPPSRAQRSAKLAALHARLALSPQLPIETLARCLIDSTADPDPRFNNSSLSLLGSSLLSYYTSEAILCRFPRLPTEVVFAAMSAYSGPKALGSITREWGVEVAAEPGGEVDPGYLQCRRLETKDSSGNPTGPVVKEVGKIRPNAAKGWRIGMSSRTVYDNQFGEEVKERVVEGETKHKLIPLEEACANFVNALMGAVYLHLGRRAAKVFFNEHVMSRYLDVARMFQFPQPTRDLAKLLAREGFASPTARVHSETGRKSRHPVFVVGVYTGKMLLGEGSGSSLVEAKTRAAVDALKKWYCYQPPEVRVPSDAVNGKKWEPLMIDGGEVVV